MRHCNCAAAQNLLINYRRDCLIPRTDAELNRFLRSFTGDMLSIIMYSYGVSSVAGNRASKEQFIRGRILQARVQPALVIDLTVINQAQAGPHSPVGPPPALEPHSPVGPPPALGPHSPVGPPPALIQPAILHHVRETMAAYKARMTVVADSMFTLICVRVYGITTYSLENSVQFREMIVLLSESITVQTNNNWFESQMIGKLITKQFHLRRAVAQNVKSFFYIALCRARNLADYIRLNAYGVLPPAQPQLVFVPHKPQFAAIQMLDTSAVESAEYCCGVCYDEFTQETIATLNCSHTICGVCITGQIEARTKSCIKCPFCREEVCQVSVRDEVIRNQISTVVTAEIAKN
jgi:uncharacterized CHY-type Zn-finger protein